MRRAAKSLPTGAGLGVPFRSKLKPYPLGSLLDQRTIEFSVPYEIGFVQVIINATANNVIWLKQ